MKTAKKTKVKEKVWVTFFALTDGIFEQEGDIFSDGRFNYKKYYFLKKNEWCREKSEAIAKAKEMQNKEIELLKNEIKRVEALKFD